MSQESLNLLAVVDVPYPHYSVFASTHKVLSIGRDGRAENLIIVSIHVPIELLTPEKVFLTTLDVP